MKQCYIDSNLLVFYSIVGSLKHNEAEEILRRLESDNANIYISPLVIDEFIYSVRNELIFSKQQKGIYEKLRAGLQAVLRLPNIQILNPPTDLSINSSIVDLMENYNLKPRDAYHLLIMQVHRIDSFATFDNDFEEVFKSGVLTRV